MAQLSDQVLQYLNEHGTVDTLQLADALKEDHQKVIGAVKSLQSLGDIIEAEQASRTKTELTAEGKSFVEKGSHEAIVFAAVPSGEGGIPQPDLMKATGTAGKIGMSKAIQNGWIKIVKEGGATKVIRVVDSIDDTVRTKLKEVASGNATVLDTAALADLKKRKLLVQTPVIYYNIKRGEGFTVQIVKLETELTPEMLASGEWKLKKFKPYNFQALGASLNSGHLHPLLKVRSEFRSILLEMGFSEMPTNRFVESSFWNFDALYVPQKHPARDAQDTFYMSQPEKCNSVPKEFMERVKAAHTGTDFDTLGYGPGWKVEESYKNCMRTHTTAVSARMLHAIGSKGEFKPAKLFSIDRVYRNETLDATHLAEFHQVEGVVADYNLNLGNLIGIMKEFFSRLGISKLRFKPAYNPYTEPSMEVFSYHEGLKKWVEVGNSGMFRPEMLLPMGIPKDVRVIAWGLSLERPTMIRYGIDNIRDLVGPRVDLQMVYNNPICRLDTNFEIGKDGSYLDNPLLKSPKREKTAQVQTSASSKNRNRRRKKKTNNPSIDQDGTVAVSQVGAAAVSQETPSISVLGNVPKENTSQAPSQIPPSSDKPPKKKGNAKRGKKKTDSEAGSKENNETKLTPNHVETATLPEVRPTPTEAASSSTASTSQTAPTTRSSKKKKKSKAGPPKETEG